jgi:hypothetical protein
MSDGYRYFQIGSDLWRLSEQTVQFRDRDGVWQPSMMPREMFLGEADEFGGELFGDEIAEAVNGRG